MIKIENVSKSYKKGKKVIDNLSLEIRDGEIFGFLGPNGVGKTTTIKMITGILEIDEGDILIENISIQKNPVEAKMQFGYVPDSPDMFIRLKGIEYLNFIADIYEIPEYIRSQRIEKYSKKFGIYDALNNKIQSYSHGMRQKIVIIGMLLHSPKNWIIDEPMTGLDPTSTYELKKIMREHADSGNSIFFSTHILDVAERLCDRIGIINEGKLLFVGTYEEIKQKLKENKSLEELYMEITKNEEENS